MGFFTSKIKTKSSGNTEPLKYPWHDFKQEKQYFTLLLKTETNSFFIVVPLTLARELYCLNNSLK